MEYQWDQAKEAANLKKHGVAFSDAALALEDPRALTIADPDAIDESTNRGSFVLAPIPTVAS